MAFWVQLARSLVKVREGEMYNDFLFGLLAGVFFTVQLFFFFVRFEFNRSHPEPTLTAFLGFASQCHDALGLVRTDSSAVLPRREMLTRHQT